MKRAAAFVAAAAAVFALTGCGGAVFRLPPSYPDGPKKDAVVNGVAAFCGDENYVIEDRSGRPFGGPTYLSLHAYCIEQPDVSEWSERLDAAFPGARIAEYRGNAFEIDGARTSSSERLDRMLVYPRDHPKYEGPIFTTGYSLYDAS